MANYSSPSKVLSCIQAGDYVEGVRGRNRSKVLAAANCLPPVDDDTAKKLGLKVNVNWGELLEIMVKSSNQLIAAMLSNQYFFTVKLPKAPPEHQSEWESIITENINLPMRESDDFFEMQRNIWCSVVTHGVGNRVWNHPENWLPKFKPMADVRIPTDTTLDYSNLNWYATREPYTVEELLNEVFNKKPNNRWNKKAIATILKNYKDTNFTDALNNYDILTQPEALLDMIKQNGMAYGGDALPVIPLWHFYFKDNGKWYMRVVAQETAVEGAENDVFLWPDNPKDDNQPVASSWRELIHSQFGDLSVDTPHKYSCVRGLGFILLEPTFYKNLTLNRWLQHVHDNLNIWLKSSDNADKARVQIQEFGNLGVLKQGLSVVPATERHQVDPRLPESLFAHLTQIVQESSSQYTQNSATQGKDDETAFKTRAIMEQVNQAMTAILLVAFKKEGYAQREIARRFCIKNSSDEDVQKFQKDCLESGVDPAFLEVKRWVVEPVTPLGMGNPTIAQAMVQQLLSTLIFPRLNPEAQNEVLHEALIVFTKDWRKAARWAPLKGGMIETDAKRESVGYFACLMEGVPIPLSQSNLIDQLEAMLPLYGAKIAVITKRNNMATVDEAAGLQNVSDYLRRAIMQFAQDKTQKAKVKEFDTIKAQQDNLARGVIERGQQAQQKAAQQNGNGAHAAELQKVQIEGAKGRQALALNAQRHQQDLAFNAAKHRQDQLLDAQETMDGIRREGFKALAEAHRNRLKSVASEEGEE